MFPPSVYAARRQRFMHAMGTRAVAIFHAPPETLRNGDAHYPFRQSSDLLYLTGFAEPDSALVLRPGEEKDRVLFFVRPRDPERETWEGRRAGPEGAVERYGADAAFPIDEFRGRLLSYLANMDDLYYALGQLPALDAELGATIARMRLSERRVGRAPKRIVDPRGTLHELRLLKAPEEIEVLARAASITGEAHVAAMRAAKPGVGEYELQAIVDGTFRKHGAVGPGYTTIVGSGANATILHYIENRDTLQERDLVLIDAGAEVDFYTADVTRTFPCGGHFTPAQRRCYDWVLRVQEEAIAMVRPGENIDAIHERVVALLTEGMVDLGLLQGSPQERIADGSYRAFYMHRTSHWLGMDVHDVGAYHGDQGAARPLEPGMVITIEPGLYIPKGHPGAPSDLQGIGIRIEDDILVTVEGHRNLTAAIPKKPGELEAICSHG